MLTYIELSRSASRLDQVIPSLESAADVLEMALSRAEALAKERYGYEPDTSILLGRKQAERENRVAEVNSERISTTSPAPTYTPVKDVVTTRKLAPSVVKTPKYSSISIAEPPTPRLEDLGLSAASMNMFRRKF